MQKINQVIFNEVYWNNGLIYTQNISPLLKLKEQKTGLDISIISFTSILLMFVKWREIRSFRKELNAKNVRLINYPIFFYPSKHFIIKWFLFPFFILNVLPYMIYLNVKDFISRSDTKYTIRSYSGALAFLKFYYKKERLYFDPRTDWIIENKNMCRWVEGDLTDRLWNSWEKKIMSKFIKTIFISDVFKSDLIERHSLERDDDKFVVLYNPIDYSKFDKVSNITKKDFLYTGSLGHWNNIRIYLDFFLLIHEFFPSSIFKIVTETPRSKLQKDLDDSKYMVIKGKLDLHYNVTKDMLASHYESCAYGLQLMNKNDNRVGVKFIEYIAAGITPIINDKVEGAAYLSKKFEMGVVLNMGLFKTEQIVSEIQGANCIDKSEGNYMAFKSVTDLNQITNILKKIYL
jgi:hypothetical protein